MFASTAVFLLAYAVVNLRAPGTPRVSTIGLTTTGGSPSPSAASRGFAVPEGAASRDRLAIVSYRDAAARAAPSVVTVYAAHIVNNPLPLSPKALVDARVAGSGAVVVAVEPDGPADRARIASGDVIVRVGEQKVAQAQDLRISLIGVEPRAHVPIDIVRNGNRTTVDVVAVAPPPQRVSDGR
jgi:S1-C subfamily serine protease